MAKDTTPAAPDDSAAPTTHRKPKSKPAGPAVPLHVKLAGKAPKPNK